MRTSLSTSAILLPLLLFAVSIEPAPAAAQVATATVRGTVVDSTGAVIPAALVVLVHEGTGDRREAIADGLGTFTFPSIYAGSYRLEAHLDGFQPVLVRDVLVRTGDTLRLEVTLTVGTQSDVVVVTASPEIVREDSGARDFVVSGDQLRNLTIIGRSAAELMRVLPGVVTGWSETVSFAENGVNWAFVNGGDPRSNVLTLDGTHSVDIGNSQGAILSANVDMLQEVRVQTSNYAAEYGASPVQVSAVTRGGSSAFRGSLYSYARDWRLSTNDRSNEIAGVREPKSSYHYPGGTLGGPVLVPGAAFNSRRDRLFFFVGAEYQRQRVDRGSTFMVVPTERQRIGDFGENLQHAANNLNQPQVLLIPKGFPGEGTPAPGNDLSPYVTSFGRALAALYPLPNYHDPENRYNFVDSGLRPLDRRQLVARVDARVSGATQAYVRIARERERSEDPSGPFSSMTWAPLPSAGRWNNGSYGVSANAASVLSSRAVNELTVSYAKLMLDAGFVDPARVSKSTYGMPEVGFFGAQTPFVPGVYMVLNQVVPMYSHPPAAFDNDTLQIADKLSWVSGAHSVKVGAAFEQASKWQGAPWNDQSGVLLFAPWTPGSTGHELGDLLVGRPFAFLQGTAPPSGRYRWRRYDLFLQDSWRARRDLTIEAGVRVTHLANNEELNDLGAIFLPEYYDRTSGAYLHGDVTRLNGVRYVARGEVPRRLLPSRAPYWLPRLNVVWDVGRRGTTMLRGGAGRYVARPMGNYDYHTQHVAPYAYTGWITAFDGLGLGDGAGLTYETLPRVDPYSHLVGVDAGAFQDPDAITFAQTRSMSAGLLQRLPWKQTIEAAYVAMRGRDIYGWRDGNAIPRGALFGGHAGNADLSDPVQRVALDSAALSQFQPYPAYGKLTFLSFPGRLQYDALQVTLSRPTGRAQYLVAYTLSKNTGTQTGLSCCANPNTIDPARSDGRMAVDKRHNLVGSFSWMVPETESPRRWLRTLANGWQLSGITTFMSGWPFVLNFSGDIASSGVVQSWFGTPSIQSGGGVSGIAPIYLRDPRLGGRSVGNRLVDLDAIAIPEFGADGPAQPPYDLRTPWTTNVDLTVFRNLRLAGTQVLQLRVGVFNVFDTATVAAVANGRWVGGIDLELETRCKVRVDNVPTGSGYASGVCDPTGGFEFTEQTKANFGTIRMLAGRRIVELAVKYSW
jgi:hypothetical protein